MADLAALIARVEAATGPDRVLDFSLLLLSDGKDEAEHRLDGQYAHLVPAYTASIDSALALVERMLPEYWWSVESGSGVPPLATIGRAGTRGIYSAKAATVPLAILAAALKALQARAGQ